MIRNYFNNSNNEKYNTTLSTLGTINYLTDNCIPNNHSKNINQPKGIEDTKTYNYLKCYKWEYDNDDQTLIIENKIEQIFQNLNKKKIKELEEDIKKINLEEIFDKNLSIKENEFNIGTLNSLDDLIEDIYHLKPFEEENKNSDKTSLIQYIFKYRKIKKDGNDFYRGVIFFFLENIILKNNKMFMKEFLIIFNEKISENNPKIKDKQYIKAIIKKINKEEIMVMLYIIIRGMEKTEIHDKFRELSDYKTLLKIFLKSETFNYGIIFFTRYLIYEYISENENKHISKEENDEIRQLLQKGEQNFYISFEEYYKKLMTMDETNAIIDYYMIPYIFKCNLNIIKYDSLNEEKPIKKKLYNCGRAVDLDINLFLRDGHHDIYYEKYYYERYYILLDIIIMEKNDNANQRKYIRHNTFQENNLDKSQKPKLEKRISDVSRLTMKDKTTSFNNVINNEKNLGNCSECKNEYYRSEKDLFGLCKNCLKMELKNKILAAYYEFLKKGYTKNYEEKLNNFLKQIKICISNQNIYLNTAIHNSGFNFKDLFSDIRANMCLYCGNNMFDNNYILNLPCGCKICKQKCLEEYMKIIEEKNKIVLLDTKDEFTCVRPLKECPCGFRYDIKAFITLINYMREKGEKGFKKIYEEQVKNNWKWTCMICREYFHKNREYFRLFLSDDTIDKKLLNKYELKHLICKTCFDENITKNNNKINCKFCKSKHIIEFLKKVDSDNKTESACIII